VGLEASDRWEKYGEKKTNIKNQHWCNAGKKQLVDGALK